MLETAKKEGYAYPAVNVTTIEVINGALRAFSEAKSDGIIQVSIGGGKFASGTSIGSSALGAIVLAEATRRLAEKHNVLVALHTDHCQPEHVDTFLRPLIAESRRRHGRQDNEVVVSRLLSSPSHAGPDAGNFEPAPAGSLIRNIFCVCFCTNREKIP